MSTRNAILIAIESGHDARAMYALLKQVIGGLTESEVLSGDITMLGGVGIKDKKVATAVNKLEALLTSRADAEADKKKVKVTEGNVIHATFGGDDDDEVVRDLPDLMPAPDTVQ